MTAEQLYEADPMFRSAIDLWIQNRRNPFELADYLREQGLHLQAAACDWCSAQPDRPPFAPYTDWGEDPTPCGVFPMSSNTASIARNSSRTVENLEWRWWLGVSNKLDRADELDDRHWGNFNFNPNIEGTGLFSNKFPTAAKAILFVLDQYRENAEADPPTPTAAEVSAAVRPVVDTQIRRETPGVAGRNRREGRTPPPPGGPQPERPSARRGE